jgi:hypothetical protein
MVYKQHFKLSLKWSISKILMLYLVVSINAEDSGDVPFYWVFGAPFCIYMMAYNVYGVAFYDDDGVGDDDGVYDDDVDVFDSFADDDDNDDYEEHDDGLVFWND